MCRGVRAECCNFNFEYCAYLVSHFGIFSQQAVIVERRGWVARTRVMNGRWIQGLGGHNIGLGKVWDTTRLNCDRQSWRGGGG